MRQAHFGSLPDGTAVEAWTLDGGAGVSATVLTYGARIMALHAPGGRNVALGLPTLADYVASTAYLGAVVGRVGNRIAGGRFRLDGTSYQLSVNNGPNTLHGGKVGFDRAVWRARADGEALLLTHTSPDGDQGFPGALHASVRYAVEGAALVIDYAARADAPTVVNLTNHCYFNLDGAADVTGHVVTLAADRFTPVRSGSIPTGELRPVEGTPFDFRAPAAIGARIGGDDEQLRLGGGYDHNFVLGDARADAPRHAATVRAGGIAMVVETTEPGMQFYSGNMMPDAGLPYRGALCLETQHFPDSANQPAFPSTVLRPGQALRSRTIYRFAPE